MVIFLVEITGRPGETDTDRHDQERYNHKYDQKDHQFSHGQTHRGVVKAACIIRPKKIKYPNTYSPTATGSSFMLLNGILGVSQSTIWKRAIPTSKLRKKPATRSPSLTGLNTVSTGEAPTRIGSVDAPCITSPVQMRKPPINRPVEMALSPIFCRS